MQKSYEKTRIFRCTDDMWTCIEEQSERYGITPSEFIRKAVDSYLKGSPDVLYTQKEYLAMKKYVNSTSELQNEVNAIGVNINQIVKNNNSHFYLEYEKKKLFALMQQLLELFRTYSQKQGDTPPAKRGKNEDGKGVE